MSRRARAEGNARTRGRRYHKLTRRLALDDARTRWTWAQGLDEHFARVAGYRGACTCLACLAVHERPLTRKRYGRHPRRHDLAVERALRAADAQRG